LKKTNELLEKELLMLRKIVASKSPVSTRSESITKPALKLSSTQVQIFRDKVLGMVAQGKPLDGIPLYQGKRVHGEVLGFFKKHYADYIIPGQEVIFAPDLKAIDEKLLVALRNECRDGVSVPIGTRADRTDAINEGRFIDSESSLVRSRMALALREFRQNRLEKVLETP
jgi:hypothetical protein